MEAGWHIELDKLVSSSVAHKTKLIRKVRGLELGIDKPRTVDISSSINSYRARFPRKLNWSHVPRHSMVDWQIEEDCHNIRAWYPSCANFENNSYKAEVLRRVRTVNYVDEWDIHILKQVQTDWAYVHTIDLFNDTAAMLNLLDIRSFMGCPEGTRSVFTRAFHARRELHCVFLR